MMADKARPEDKAEPAYGAFLKHVGERIRAARRLTGMTQTELANAIGATQPYIVAIEAGENLTLKSLARISDVLKVEPVALLSAGKLTAATEADIPDRMEDLIRRAAHDANELSKLLLELQAIIPGETLRRP